MALNVLVVAFLTLLIGLAFCFAGILLLLRVIPLSALMVGAIIRGSLLWSLAWFALAVVGIIVQLSSTQHYDQGYAHSQFS